jgi:subtilisin family serine protease
LLATTTALCAALVAAPSTGTAAPAAPTEVFHDVIVTLIARAPLDSVDRSGSQRARRARVIGALKSTAATTQQPVLAQLTGLAARGEVREVQPFWISNVIAVSATDQAIALLRSRPDVLSVEPESAFAAPGESAAGTVEPNLTQVNAPALWAQGSTGAGIVVAMLDTGADVDHPDLTGSWRGGANSWFDPYGQHPETPVDVNGHGTWTTGVVVGGSGGGSAIGMAPGARWIVARVFDDQDRGTSSGIHAALQWAIDPDHDASTDDGADVVNNSWAFGAPGCDLEFQADLAALRALDVLPVFAAGNGGPAVGSSYSPANYPEAVAVGAVDASDTVLADSSRGPTTCGGRSRVFPDLVAPGAAIRTSDLFSLWVSRSGTSMAAPHVTGALALLLSRHSGLSAADQETALVTGAADLGDAGPDDVYGAGRLDVLAAALTLPDTEPPMVTAAGATPNPAAGTPHLTVTATVTDDVAATAVTLSEQGARAPTLAAPMQADDGAFDEPSEAVTATIDVSGWSAGEHLLRLDAVDGGGNRSVTALVSAVVGPADLVFGDGFESGSLTRWSSAVGGSRLSVDGTKAIVGLQALRATLAGTDASYVEDASPAAETANRARFWFDGGDARSGGHDVLLGLDAARRPVFELGYRRTTKGQMQLRVGTLAGRKTTWTAWTNLAVGPHRLELEWKGGASGQVRLYVDGALRAGTSPGANLRTLELVRLGPSLGMTTSSTGSQLFDAFASSRTGILDPG